MVKASYQWTTPPACSSSSSHFRKSYEPPVSVFLSCMFHSGVLVTWFQTGHRTADDVHPSASSPRGRQGLAPLLIPQVCYPGAGVPSASASRQLTGHCCVCGSAAATLDSGQRKSLLTVTVSNLAARQASACGRVPVGPGTPRDRPRLYCASPSIPIDKSSRNKRQDRSECAVGGAVFRAV